MALLRQSVRDGRASAVRPSEKRVFTADVDWGILGGLRLVHVSSRTTIYRFLKKGRLQYMKDPIRTLARGGADGEALADFRCLADATSANGGPRYRSKAHLSWLSAVIAGEHMSGQNRDKPLYALCHLVLMIDIILNESFIYFLKFLLILMYQFVSNKPTRFVLLKPI